MPRISHRRAFFASTFAVVACFPAGGCAVRYYDAKTGTEHVWGLAHVKLRVAPSEGTPAPAVITQVETVGVDMSFTSGPAGDAFPSDAGLGLGWQRRTRVLMPDDTSLSLEWPTTDLFDVRLGAHPPFLPHPLPAENSVLLP